MKLVVSILLLLLPAVALRANVTEIVVSTDCASCDGSTSLEVTMSGTVTFELYTHSGTFITVVESNDGLASFDNLCPDLYRVQFTNGSENDVLWFSIGTQNGSAGEFAETTICTGVGNVNLFNRLEGTPTTGGIWLDPLGNPFGGLYNSTSGLPGLYTYEVLVDGCPLQSGLWVVSTENADPGLSTTYLICEDYEPFFLTDVLAGTPDEGGQWFNSSQQAIDGFYYPETDQTGLFTYMIDTVDQCPAVFSTMFVIENNLPNPGEDASVFVCPNAVPFPMIDFLGGNPEAGGTWLNAVNQPVPAVFDPETMEAGTYTYRVPGATPCPAQEASLTIQFSEGISAGIPSDATLCQSDDFFDLHGQLSGPYTEGGVWLDPSGNLVDAIIDPFSAASGAYTYLVSAVGCQAVSALVNISILTPPNPGEGGTLQICETQASIDPNELLNEGADPGGTWLLENQELIGLLNVQGGFNYDLSYQFPAGVCPQTEAAYTLQVGIQPQAETPVFLELCNEGQAISLNDAISMTAGFEVTWTAPDGTLTDGMLDPTIDPEGTYSFEVLADNGCENLMGITEVGYDEWPFAPGTEEFDWCYDGGQVNLFDLSQTELPLGGQWFFGEVPVNALIEPGAFQPGTFSYDFPHEGACGNALLVLEVSVETALSAGSGADVLVCSNSAPVDASAILDNASAGGSWFIDETEIDNPLFDPGQGEDALYVYVVPANGPCPSDTSFISFEVDEGFAFTGGFDVELCENDASIQLGESSCTDCTYQWSPLEGLNNPTTASPTFTPFDVSESTTLTLTVEVSNGVCTLNDEVLITLHPVPEIQWEGDVVVCEGEELSLLASGADSFEWSVNGDLIGSDAFLEFAPVNNNPITITATSAEACISEAVVSPQVLPAPQFDVFVSEDAACFPAEFVLQVAHENTDNLTVEWTVDGQLYTGEEAIVNSLLPGSYDLGLSVMGSNGCVTEFIESGSLEVYPRPLSSFDFPLEQLTVLNPLVQFENRSIGAETYEWNFGGLAVSNEFEPAYAFPEVADQGYRVCLEVANSFACTDSSCQDVYIPGELVVYVPNAFTPDQDGINEVFFPRVSGFDQDSYRFQIFNRWGELLFESRNPGEAWQGNAKGGAHYAPDGSYIWTLEVRDAYSAETKRFEGHVLLMR